MKILILCTLSLSLISCTSNTDINLLTADSISGFAQTFNSSSSSNSVAMSCSEVTVHLYNLDQRGNKIMPEVASTKVNANGTYVFKNIRGLIPFKKDSPEKPYIIESTGCGKKYSRVLTGSKKQDITFGTSLINYTLQTELKDELAQTFSKINDLENLYNSVRSSTDYDDAFTKINNDATVKDNFENLFDDKEPVVLQNAPPVIQGVVVPTTVKEGDTHSISVNSYHWSSTYNQVVIWKLDNEVISNSVTFNYEFLKNTQGEKTLSLYIGQDDGSGDLDLTKPHLTRTFDISIDNSYPASVPALTIANSTVTTTLLSLNIDTGASLINCESFSKFVITENQSTTPAASDFTESCSDAGTQVFDYNLSSTNDGLKVLKLWTIDSSGSISTSPSVLNVTLDRNAPVLNSVSINNGNQYSGTPFVNLNLDISDLSPPLQVRIAEADPLSKNCQAEYANDNWLSYSNSFTPIPYLVSNSDGVKKLCVWAKDKFDFVTTHIPTAGINGVSYDEINYEVGNVPEVTLLKLSNNSAGVKFGTESYSAGESVKIEWNAFDVEGLDDNPVSLYYTTDNINWITIVEDFGGLTGEPTAFNSSYTSFVAPTSGYFKIKILVIDKSGNSSVPINSNAQNTGNWSIYAGTTDRGAGSSAASTSLSQTGNSGGLFAINPMNNDIYFTDKNSNILRMDALTGLTEVFIKHGALNLTTSGTIDSDSQIRTGSVRMNISNDGTLFLMDFSGGDNISSIIFKVNLADKSYVKYLSGGNNLDTTTMTSDNAYILRGPMAVDESNSLYLTTKCVDKNWDRFTDAFKIIKVTQKADGTADKVTHFAGNCVRANLAGDGPFDAKTSSLGAYHYPSISDFTVWDNGNKFVYHFYPTTPVKIINGQIYKTDIIGGLSVALHYNKSNQKLYVGQGGVREYTLNLNGPNGDTYTDFISGAGTSNTCLNDDILASDACVNAHFTIHSNSIGTTFFVDGPDINATRDYRIRYKDNSGKMRTVAGNNPFYGDGRDKSTMRGVFSGVYYKKSSEPHQAIFPTGLYFMEQKGMVLGHIDPQTNLVKTVVGSQKGSTASHNTGDQLSKDSNLGRSYSGGNGMPLDFVNGLPYLRYESRALKIDENKKAVRIQNSRGYFEDAVEGSKASSTGLFVFGGFQNFTFKDDGLFLIGRYRHTNRPIDTPIIQYLDFAADVVTKVMGNTGTVSSPDITTPGLVKEASINSACLLNGRCHVEYIDSQDRLYFVDGTTLRYIHKPTDTANSTLATLFDAGGLIDNFIFKEDLSMVFYTKNDGRLYCHDINSGESWCDGSSLGPSTGLATIKRGPNQFTWADDRTLIISNYQGLIYKYKLPQ